VLGSSGLPVGNFWEGTFFPFRLGLLRPVCNKRAVWRTRFAGAHLMNTQDDRLNGNSWRAARTHEEVELGSSAASNVTSKSERDAARKSFRKHKSTSMRSFPILSINNSPLTFGLNAGEIARADIIQAIQYPNQVLPPWLSVSLF